MKRSVANFVFIALCAVTLLACANGNAGGGGSAAQTVQAYLEARVQGDLDKMINLSCSDWEAQARVEATSFKSMKASLDGVACQDSGTAGQYSLVSCKGKIVTSYNGESRDWSVADHPYRVVKDGGDWRMCGYQQ
ncbi:MAG TPA: hypothetical protein VGK81_13790 [Anaerolineae bacterium]